MSVHCFPIQLRFGDEDVNGHVNNVRFFQFLEDARVQLGMMPLDAEVAGAEAVTFRGLLGADASTFVAHQEIEYLAPLQWRPEPVGVQIWVTSVGTSSFSYGFRITDAGPVLWPDAQPEAPAGAAAQSTASCRTYAVAEATMVLVDAATGFPRRLAESHRRVLHSLQAEPVPFRRRAVAAGGR